MCVVVWRKKAQDIDHKNKIMINCEGYGKVDLPGPGKKWREVSDIR